MPEAFPHVHRVDYHELFLALFDCHNLKGDFLKIISDEYNSLVSGRVHQAPGVLDDLETAALDDIQRALP